MTNTVSDGQVGLVTEKVITLLTMGAVTFICGLLPIKLMSQVRQSSNNRWTTFISFCSCFSGGVFLAACMLDLLPDVEEKTDQIKEEIKKKYDVDLNYPLAQFAICCGFFMILTVEQFVHFLQEAGSGEEGENQPLLSQGSSSSYQSAPTHSHQHSHHHSSPIVQNSSLRSLMLLLALSLHSVFEGLAIGLQETTGDLISITVAVISHKAVMAFSLGLNLAQSNLSLKNFITSNIIFSIASPIGISIGIGMSSMAQSLPNDIISGILQGIAGGTFLYITFLEVLPQELNVQKNRLWKVLFILIGFSCICGLLMITQ